MKCTTIGQPLLDADFFIYSIQNYIITFRHRAYPHHAILEQSYTYGNLNSYQSIESDYK